MKLSLLLVSLVLLFSFSVGAASAGSYWGVTVTGTSQDTIWVQVEPHYQPTAPCSGQWGDCGANMGSILNVSPCPLAKTCTGSGYSAFFNYDLNPQVTLCLQPGVDYTFSGSAWNYVMFGTFMGPDMQWVCMQGCSENIAFDPIVFGSPVGTKPQTWGQIKALFR